MKIKIKLKKNDQEFVNYLNNEEFNSFNDEVNSLLDLSNKIESLINHQDELSKSDILDTFYFITRESLLKNTDQIKPIVIRANDFSNQDVLFLKSIFLIDDKFIEEDSVSLEVQESIQLSNSYINYILYSIIKNKDKIKDIKTVYHFIDNHFERRFSDLILFYSLNKEYSDKILTDISPVVLHEYELKKFTIPELSEILEKEPQEIEELYKKIWRSQIILNNSHINLQLVKSPKATEFMIIDYCTKVDFSFIYKDILSHINCPLDFLRSAINTEVYIEEVINNKKTTNDILQEIYNNDIIFSNLENITNLIYEHGNCSDELQIKILNDIKIMNNADSILDLNELKDCTPNIKHFIYNQLNKEELADEMMVLSKNKENSSSLMHSKIIKDKLISVSLIDLFEFTQRDYQMNKILVERINKSSIGEVTEFYNVISPVIERELEDSIFDRVSEIASFCGKDESVEVFDFLSRVKNNSKIKESLINNENTDSFVLKKLIS